MEYTGVSAILICFTDFEFIQEIKTKFIIPIRFRLYVSGIFFGGGNISQLWYNNTHGTFFLDEFFRIIRIIWQREYFLTFSLRTGCFDPSVFKLFKIFD